MKDAIKEMLSESDGTLSMARCTLAFVVVWVVVKSILFNILAAVHGTAPIAMDPSDIALVSAAIAGKTFQAILGEKAKP